MASARLNSDPGQEYALLRFTALGEYVLGAADEVRLVEPSEDVWVELRCERCGRWTREAYPRPRERERRAEGAIWLCLPCLKC